MIAHERRRRLGRSVCICSGGVSLCRAPRVDALEWKLMDGGNAMGLYGSKALVLAVPPRHITHGSCLVRQACMMCAA